MVEHDYKNVKDFFDTFRMHPLFDLISIREEILKTQIWRGDPALWKAKDEFLKQLEVAIHSVIKEMNK